MVPIWEFWNPASGFLGGMLAGLFAIAVVCAGVAIVVLTIRLFVT